MQGRYAAGRCANAGGTCCRGAAAVSEDMACRAGRMACCGVSGRRPAVRMEVHPGCAARVEQLIGSRARVWQGRDAAAAASRKRAAAAAAAASESRSGATFSESWHALGGRLARAQPLLPDEAGPPAPSRPVSCKTVGRAGDGGRCETRVPCTAGA